MDQLKMTCRSDYLIGIDYDSIEEDKGHMTLHRAVPISELVEEVKDIMLNGCHFPQFPPEANPEIVYAYDLNDKEDTDVYGEIVNKLKKSLERSNNGSNY